MFDVAIPGKPYLTETEKKKINLNYLGSIEDIHSSENKQPRCSSNNLDNQNFSSDNLCSSLFTTKMEYGTIAQPLVSSKIIKDKENNTYNLETNIFIFDNYKSKILIDNLIVYQNFRRGIDGKYQLAYHICFKESNDERGKYSLYRLTLTNLNIEYTAFGNTTPSILDVKQIDEVVAFITNTNPKTSRGTVTTVQPPVKTSTTNSGDN